MSDKINALALAVRQSSPDEYPALAELFNKVHAGNPGLIQRSAADLAWRCQKYPGMSPEGGLLVEDADGTLHGYAFVKDNGKILEFAVDRNDSYHQAAVLLMAACEERARESGADRLTVNTRGGDLQIDDVMREVGMIPTKVKSLMHASAVDPGALLDELLLSPDDPDLGCAFTIRLSDPHEWQTREYTVRPRTTGRGESSVTIEADNRTFNDILLGGRSPMRLVLRGRIRIRPIGRTVEIVRLLERVQVKGSWFYTKGDVL